MNLEDTVREFVEECVKNCIEDQVESCVDNMDFDEKIKNCIDLPDFDEKVTDAINDYDIDGKIDEAAEGAKAELEDTVNETVETVVNDYMRTSEFENKLEEQVKKILKRVFGNLIMDCIPEAQVVTTQLETIAVEV